MNEYFRAIQVHLEDRCDMGIGGLQGTNAHILCSVGVDKIIYRRDLLTQIEDKKQMDEKYDFTAIAVHPLGLKCCLGDKSKMIIQYEFDTGTITNICETLGAIVSLQYSKSGCYICVGTEECKCLIIQIKTSNVVKCRPGHSQTILQAFFNSNQNLVVSIGSDQYLLIYELNKDQQPKQKARHRITSLSAENLRGCFSYDGEKIYAPGTTYLNIIEQLNNKWQIRKSQLIHHNQEIIMVALINSDLVITSCKIQVSIWNIHKQEQLILIDNFYLYKVIAAHYTIYGIRNDGKIYQYKRQLPTIQTQKMQIQSEQSQLREIQFQNQQNQQQQSQQLEQIDQQAVSIHQQQIRYIQSKKSKADKLITCYPQGQVTTGTTYYDNKRFIFINRYAFIIQKMQNDDIYIEVQYRQEKNSRYKGNHRMLFHNRDILYFDVNSQFVAYASANQFGVKTNKQSSLSSWENKWNEIQAITMGAGWLAVCNDEEIKIFDVTGNQCKSIGFDRQIVAMTAFQNILTVVYHQAVPMWGVQSLAMQFFVVDRPHSTFLKSVQAHVPITSQSMLKWFGFSAQGMLISQDTYGSLRAYSLEANEWTSIFSIQVDDPKRVWILYVENYQIFFWKTTQIQPQPTVGPRLNEKQSQIGIATLTDGSIQLEQYPNLLWRRFTLDFEKWRNRSWGRIKSSRSQQNAFYHLSCSIKSEKQILTQHIKLDYKFHDIIKYYLKNKQHNRAVYAIKSLIRSTKIGKGFIQLLDDLDMRQLAIQLENYYDEKERQIQYESLQLLQCQELKTELENMIPSKPINPMRRVQKSGEVIPSLSLSQNSQYSQQRSITSKTQVQQDKKGSQQKQYNNPFAKKKFSQDGVDIKKKLIQQQMNKYKRKNDEQSIHLKTLK